MRTVALDDPRATDRQVTGAKASFLSLALRRGLPVLPGVVVPVSACAEAVRLGVETLSGESGSGAARLAAMKATLDPDLVTDLEAAVASFGGPAIVRSSSAQESDGPWAGAFSTFAGVEAGDVATAVRGCWASLFGVEVLELAEEADVDPATLSMAVLVQPQIMPESGGVATAHADGPVEVVGVRGTPQPLLQGWTSGHRAVVTDGTPDDGSAVVELGADVVADVASLAARVLAETGRGRIEWAWTDGGVVLLQAEPVQSPPVVALDEVVDLAQLSDLTDPALATHVAHAVASYHGPLAEALVLPLVARARSLPTAAGSLPDAEPLDAWRGVCAQVEAEIAAAWGSTRAAADWCHTLRTEPAEALDALDALPSVDAAVAERILATLEYVGAALAGAGLLRRPSDVWRVDPADVEPALAEGRPLRAQSVRQSLTGWQSFLHAAVARAGRELPGHPAVAGLVTGLAARVDNPHAVKGALDGMVIVTELPLPAIAPLLWSAGGLVIGVDNTAAHLLEVASSVGVPTVVGVDLGKLLDHAEPALVTVDGYRGVVAGAALDQEE